jgi:hypothetical protein
MHYTNNGRTVEKVLDGQSSFMFDCLTVLGATIAVHELNALLRAKYQQPTRLEVNQDAVRYQFLVSIDPIRAQSFFWKVQPKKERNKAIDEAILAANNNGLKNKE